MLGKNSGTAKDIALHLYVFTALNVQVRTKVIGTWELWPNCIPAPSSKASRWKRKKLDHACTLIGADNEITPFDLFIYLWISVTCSSCKCMLSSVMVLVAQLFLHLGWAVNMSSWHKRVQLCYQRIHASECWAADAASDTDAQVNKSRGVISLVATYCPHAWHPKVAWGRWDAARPELRCPN